MGHSYRAQARLTDIDGGMRSETTNRRSLFPSCLSHTRRNIQSWSINRLSHLPLLFFLLQVFFLSDIQWLRNVQPRPNATRALSTRSRNDDLPLELDDLLARGIEELHDLS